MAIFNKPDQQTNITTNSTIISSNTKIRGTINTDCTLHIDGDHEGIVHARGAVTIGRTGKIDGDVVANKLTITGMFQGTADCEHVQIQAGGTLRGKVISNHLTIDKDCSFEGESLKKQQVDALAQKAAATTQNNTKGKAS